jgi:hypothetical protein
MVVVVDLLPQLRHPLNDAGVYHVAHSEVILFLPV